MKALAAPTAALIGITTAAVLAVRGFRAQKRIERRLKWYDEVLDAIDQVRTAYLAVAIDPDNLESKRAAAEAYIESRPASTQGLPLRGAARTKGDHAMAAGHFPDFQRGYGRGDYLAHRRRKY